MSSLTLGRLDPPADPLTAAIRAAVRAELAPLLAELRRADAKPHASIAEAASELRVSGRTVRRFIATGRLKAAKLGSRTVVLRASLDKLLVEATL